MLTVKTPQAAQALIAQAFASCKTEVETVCIWEALGRVLAEDIVADQWVPGFDRSTVDGFAVKAEETFGCSDSIPAMLQYVGEVRMGAPDAGKIETGQCKYVPTGGELPQGANAMVMIEYVEDYGDGMRYMCKPSAPGQHVIFRGDDVKPGDVVLTRGRTLRPQDIGALAALGVADVPVRKRPVVGILSTGDEVIDIRQTPVGGQIRDVNTHALYAGVQAAGGQPVALGIVQDEYDALYDAVRRAVQDCDMVLVSGGSSVGTRDATHRVIDALGTPGVLMHGVAIKPGKPTIVGSAGGKPVFGLPGHPVSAYFIYHIFARPLICAMMDAPYEEEGVYARLTATIPSNHGREECVSVQLVRTQDGLAATPVVGKSGLITVLSRAGGYVRVPRDCEGISAGSEVEVFRF